MVDKVQKLKEEINQNEGRTTRYPDNKPSWAIKTDTKLVDLQDCFRRSNLRFEGIKVHENESWNTIYWKTNLKWILKTLSSSENIEPGKKQE